MISTQEQDTRLNYQAYMLRLWSTQQEKSADRRWRFSLEDPRTGERLGFATLEALVNFLQAQTCAPQIEL